LLAISTCLAIGVVEVVLRAFSVFPIHNNLNIQPHSSLGHTLNPRLNDVDRYGFRNTENGIKNAEIIAIGDSHTQGFNVSAKNSWPTLLSKKLNKKVYNYGVGGYGFAQYAYLLETKLAQEANTVIVALYPANDIRPGVCALVPQTYYQTLFEKQIVETPCSSEFNPIENKPVTLSSWFTAYSATLSAIKYFISAHWIAKENYYEVSGHLIKKSRVSVRNKITDLSNPEVKHNFEATLRILKNAHARNKKLGVLLIPSKGNVLRTWSDSQNLESASDFNVSNETKLIRKFTQSLIKLDIPVIDATPYLLDAFAVEEKAGRLLYPQNDGHPLEQGYASYSEAADDLLDIINSPHD